MRIRSEIVEALLRQEGLRFMDRSVYLWTASLHPGSVRELALATGLTWRSTAESCRRLAAAGWLHISREAALSTRPIPLIPAEVQVLLAQRLEAEYALAPHKGEFLMRQYLDLLVRNDNYVDNARPDFLQSPLTGYPLEYDRFYLQGIAFEFNGAHHLGPGPGVDEATYKETRTRDLLKAALSREAGVELVIIKADDLLPGAFEARIPSHLQRNDVAESGAYYRTLARIATAYVTKVRRMSGR